MEKTIFVCRFGTFLFDLIPFGLMNALSTFQRMMDQLLDGLSFVRVYLDDVVVFSKNIDENYEHLKIVLEPVASSNLNLNISKCFFVQSRSIGKYC